MNGNKVIKAHREVQLDFAACVEKDILIAAELISKQVVDHTQV